MLIIANYYKYEILRIRVGFVYLPEKVEADKNTRLRCAKQSDRVWEVYQEKQSPAHVFAYALIELKPRKQEPLTAEKRTETKNSKELQLTAFSVLTKP